MSNNAADLFNVRSHNPSFFSVKESAVYNGPLLDFCIPVNLHFPPPEMVQLISERLPEILRYYPDYADVHAKHIGEIAGVPPEFIVPANGSTEIITRLCHLTRGPILTPIPTFSRWTDLPEELGVPLYTITLDIRNDFRLDVGEVVARVNELGVRMLVISNPNNPTGAWFEADEIEELVMRLPQVELIVIDESFLDFSGIESAAALIPKAPNLVVVKSLGKSLGWHGVRLGYAATNPRAAELLRSQLPFWNVNGLAAYILKSVTQFKDEFRQSLALVEEDRTYMLRQLQKIPGLRVFPSRANFLYVELPANTPGRALRDRVLKEYGLLVRECSNKLGSSEQYLRLAVQTKASVDLLIAALTRELPTGIESFRYFGT
ncbi:MAG TPA: histidinol-phosphate transaminase [Pyrinomonadaceae bacterium]|nr:histidinol-phosphate transaminase [Pyrinomonadaceae bacterium]